MHYFVALLWNVADAEQAGSALQLASLFSRYSSTWRAIVEAPGLTLFQPARQWSYVLPGNRGAVVGTLFTNARASEVPSRLPSVDADSAEKMVRTMGRHLTDEFWGGYVAFLRNTEGTRTHVIRDCSGAVSCYRMRVSKVDVVFSDLESLKGMPLPPFSLN